MEIKKDIFSVVDDYDTFFVDIYGVLFDGAVMYEHALSSLKKLKKLGKKIVILSNTTQISSDAKIGYAQREMFEGVHYDKFITSGEFLHETVLNNIVSFSNMIGPSAKTVKCMFIGNNNVFAESHLQKVDNYDDADFLYVGIPRISYGAVRMDDVFDKTGNPVNIEDVVFSDWHVLQDSKGRNGFEEFAHQLEVCLKKNKTLLVANPDIFAHGTLDSSNHRFPIVTQGCLGKYYEKLGGKVVYFGKPYQGIFDFAKHVAGSTEGERIAMVGDTPWTDILGANLSNIDSIMVMTGVTQEFFEKMPPKLQYAEKLDILFNKISPKLSGFSNRIEPTHIIESFA